jgi:hypothetical protein
MHQPDQRSKSLRFALAGAAAVVAACAAGFAGAATQAAPANTAAPTVSGTPKVGQTLSATTGTWTNSPSEFGYQWLRCTSGGGSCAAVANGNQKIYTLIPADAGHTTRVRVTASNVDGSAAALSEPTEVVASSAVPRARARPIVSGTPELGETLTADEGDWTANPTSYSFKWQRCEADNIAACVYIAGATAKTYTLRAIDVGYRVRSEVTARNANGASVAYSATTSVIRPKLKITNERPTLKILSVKLLGHTVYARLLICDDSNKNLTIIQTTSRSGKLSYARRFSTLAAPQPCGVYTRHWSLVQRFRGPGRVSVTLQARDKSGDTSAAVRRSFARG